MDTIQGLNNTILEDRILWYDGDTSVRSADLQRMVVLGIPTEGLFVDEITEETKRFNKLVSKQDQITTKQDVRPFSREWNLPEYYKTLNVRDYVIQKLQTELSENNFDDDQCQIRTKRVLQELKLYQHQELIDVLRALIFVINTLKQNDIVWGVGRGSSVSSYVLYLIEVHDVDSVLYDLKITDFLRPD